MGGLYMNLKNGYKVIYEQAAGGKRDFYASKSVTYPNEDDLVIASFNDEAFRGKLIYERDGKIFVSDKSMPTYDENGNPADTVIEGFDKIFPSNKVVLKQNPHTEAISTNKDSHGKLTVNEDTITLNATGEIGWKKSAWGTYGNWVGFKISVPENVDAATAIYTRPNGKASPLSEVLDTGKNYASVYSDMSKYGNTATYYLDWNGDGVNDLTVIIDVSKATLLANTDE